MLPGIFLTNNGPIFNAKLQHSINDNVITLNTEP